jgi:chemotaxis protein MotB
LGKKRQVHEEHENHERWLVSYADFITLLFAFFVVMYSVSRVDNRKLNQAVAGIQWALHYSGTGGVGTMPIFDGPPSEGGCAVNIGASSRKVPNSQVIAIQSVQRRIERRLRHLLLDRNQPKAVTIVADGMKLGVRLAAARFFDPAQAALRPEALPVLDAVASELAAMGRPIRIEGHTDDSPIQNPRFHNNWELSAARAATVVAYLEEAHSVPGARLVASGMGSARPLGANDSPDGREANRRIEMVIELGPDDPTALATR